MTEELATTAVGCRTSDSDLYAALMLSDLLENKKEEEQIPKAPDTPPNEEEEEQEEDFTNVIWVPADKHPQIAPTEFAKFIQTQGTSIPIRRANSLHRQKSILSQSTTSQEGEEVQDEDEEDEDLKRTLSEKKRAFLKRISVENERLASDTKTHVFDRNSTAYDDSRIIAPRTDRSLLRRSAFSARGRGRKSNVESMDHENKKTKRRSRRREAIEPLIPTQKGDEEEEKDALKSTPWDKSEGVMLYDQPVNMSEWIDLGSASLESDDSQRGILSRVHDAESQLRSQISQEEGKEDKDEEKKKDTYDAKEEVMKTIENNDDTSNIPPSLPSQQVVVQDGPKRPTIKRTSELPTTVIVNKQEKRSSWLTNLFQDKKHGSTNNNKKSSSASASPAAATIQITSNNSSSSSPLSTLATLFTRSLSIKSNASSNLSTSSSLHSTVTSATIEEQQQGKKKRSSRLEIPPPSQRTFFNTNRLPLHVERAIYRLSHIKLANPKRPLSQQVLISNLMFWYLSIQQNDHQLIQQQQQQQQYQQLANEHGLSLDTIAPPPPSPTLNGNSPKKMGNSKMSRLIHSAKRKKGEMAQLVQSYPTVTNNTPIKSSKHNVQFNLPSIPNHNPHSSIEDEEDNVPLSHFKN
ncbi:hypothetical protein K501DRAFT_334532 [Backusella circina FSU 941]|nr:hypothetical protein K501DRAFT_334532 [Backusella circina FSU 941]